MIRCSSFAEKAMADEGAGSMDWLFSMQSMVLAFWGIKVGRMGGFAKTKIYDSALSALS